MRTITLELNDEQIQALEAKAESFGVQPTTLLGEMIDKECDLFGDDDVLDLTDPWAGLNTTIQDGARVLLSR